MKTLSYSSHRRKSVSSSLIFQDFCFRWNDEFRMIQRFLSKPVPQFIQSGEENTYANP